MNKLKKYLLIATVDLITGSLFAISLTSYSDINYQLFAKHQFNYGLTLILLALALAPFGYIAINGLILPFFKSKPLFIRLRYALLSLFVGMFFVYVIPLTYLGTYSFHRLMIIPTGQKNFNSKSGDIEIIELSEFVNSLAGLVKPVSEYDLKGDWVVQKNTWPNPGSVLIATGDDVASLSFNWNGNINQDLQLRIWSGPTQGIVKIVWDGAVRSVDLYSALGHDLFIRLNVEPNGLRIGLQIIVFVINTASLSIFFLSLLIWFLNIKVDPSVESVKNYEWIQYTIFCVAVWLIVLLSFWPGVMSPDSVDQWGQVVTGNYWNGHPILHTLTIWLVTRIWFSPAAVVLLQIICLGLLVGWGLMIGRRIGLSRFAAWLVCIVFALYPLNFGMVVTLWKDVLYSMALAGISFILIETVLKNGSNLDNLKTLVMLTLLSILASLYRHNGLPVALGALFFLAISYWSKKARVFVVVFITLTVYFIVQWPVRNWLHVAPGPFSAEFFLLHPIAAHVSAGTSMTDEDVKFLSTFHPINSRWEYVCNYAPPVAGDYDYVTPIQSHPGKLAATFASFSIKKPLVTLQHYICLNSYIWQIQPHRRLVTLVFSNDASSWVFSNSYGIVSASKLPALPGIITQLIKLLDYYSLGLIYRPALYMYFFGFTLILAATKLGSARIFLIGIPIFLNNLTLMFTSVNQEMRYVYVIYILCILLSPSLISMVVRYRPVLINVPLAD